MAPVHNIAITFIVCHTPATLPQYHPHFILYLLCFFHRQHLELTRDISRRFNDQFCKKAKIKTFKDPTAMIVKEGARVMSLQDGSSKMSKSAENDNSRINLLDSPDVILKKIKKCKTDQATGLEWDNPDRPECTNLLNIYQSVSPGRTKEDILNEVGAMNWYVE